MLNNSNLKNTIDRHMKTLPHDVQEAIHASSWERKILDIGRRYGLHVNQLEILQTELSLAVLGLTNRSEFVKETMDEARIDRHVMETMVEDINREIFEPIRSYLKKTRQHEDEIQQRDEELGIHHDEKQILKQHGIYLDLDNEETRQVSNEVFPKEAVLEETQKKVLSQPLRIERNNVGVVPPTSSIEDVMKIKDRYTSQNEENNPRREDEKKEEQEDISSKIFGESLDHNALPSAKTQEHQNNITNTKKVFYEKGDPYRESIV